jgi:hypothetical protein
MTRRSRIVGFGSAALLVVAGIGCAFVFSGTLGQNLAFVLVALGLVLATALVFAEVGLTEDHEREREEAARSDEEAARRRDEARRGRPRIPARRRLPRTRDHQRRPR